MIWPLVFSYNNVASNSFETDLNIYVIIYREYWLKHWSTEETYQEEKTKVSRITALLI